MSGYLNNRIVDELKTIMQDDINVLFEAYIDDTQKKLVNLSEAVTGTDYELTRRLAHSIKGSSRNVGASELSELCELLETAARNQQSEEWITLNDKIKLAFTHTCQQINTEILS